MSKTNLPLMLIEDQKIMTMKNRNIKKMKMGSIKGIKKGNIKRNKGKSTLLSILRLLIGMKGQSNLVRIQAVLT